MIERLMFFALGLVIFVGAFLFGFSVAWRLAMRYVARTDEEIFNKFRDELEKKNAAGTRRTDGKI